MLFFRLAQFGSKLFADFPFAWHGVPFRLHVRCFIDYIIGTESVQWNGIDFICGRIASHNFKTMKNGRIAQRQIQTGKSDCFHVIGPIFDGAVSSAAVARMH